MVVVGVARLVGVVMGRSGSADLLLEPGEGDPVYADVAVHPDVPAYGLLISLHKQAHDLFVRPEVAGVGDGDLGIRSGELPALAADPFLEDTGKEKVGEDDDPACAQLLQALQPPSAARGTGG